MVMLDNKIISLKNTTSLDDLGVILSDFSKKYMFLNIVKENLILLKQLQVPQNAMTFYK